VKVRFSSINMHCILYRSKSHLNKVCNIYIGFRRVREYGDSCNLSEELTSHWWTDFEIRWCYISSRSDRGYVGMNEETVDHSINCNTFCSSLQGNEFSRYFLPVRRLKLERSGTRWTSLLHKIVTLRNMLLLTHVPGS